MYLEGKVLEMLSLIIKGMSQPQRHIPVKLDYKDIRNLKKTVTLMRNDLAAYPSGEKLAQIAGMSPTRYQLAFKKHYGTTPYEYLKELRLNRCDLSQIEKISLPQGVKELAIENAIFNKNCPIPTIPKPKNKFNCGQAIMEI